MFSALPLASHPLTDPDLDRLQWDPCDPKADKLLIMFSHKIICDGTLIKKYRLNNDASAC